jgi:hypothetical protein
MNVKKLVSEQAWDLDATKCKRKSSKGLGIIQQSTNDMEGENGRSSMVG